MFGFFGGVRVGGCGCFKPQMKVAVLAQTAIAVMC